MKLNGKPFKLSLPPKDALQRFLDSTGHEEYFTSPELSARLGVAQRVVIDQAGSLPEYSVKVGRTRYFAKPKNISILRKQVA